MQFEQAPVCQTAAQSVAKNYPRGGYRDLLKKLPTSVGSVCRRLLLGEELTGRLRNYQSDWTLAGNESIRSVKSNSILEAQKGSYVLCQYVAVSFGKRLPMCVPSTTVFKTHWYFLFKVIKLPKKKHPQNLYPKNRFETCSKNIRAKASLRPASFTSATVSGSQTECWVSLDSRSHSSINSSHSLLYNKVLPN